MHKGHRGRLKERYLREGLTGFAPHEVLELLLCYAIPQRDVNPLAHQLIEHYGSLAAVLESTPDELMRFSGVGKNAATLLSMLPGLSGYYLRDRFGKRPMLHTAVQAGEYCLTLFYGIPYEAVYLLCLDAQGRLIHPALLQNGTIDESPVYPRDVVSTALRHNAHAVVLAHNHPGGGILPSPADYQVTEMVIEALQVVEIQTIDHIIVADGDFLSMAQHNMIHSGAPRATKGLEEKARNVSSSGPTMAAIQRAMQLEGYDAFEKAKEEQGL